MKKIVELIKQSKNIVISGHKYPDGDAIGAMLALGNIIKKSTNNNVRLCLNHNLPKYVEKLNINIPIEYEINDDIDLLIAVDTANLERLAVTENMIKNSKHTLNIDHHISNTKYFEYNYVVDCAAACQIIYDFLDIFNVQLDSEIAKYIYLGIINDTSNFKHSNTTSQIFKIASELLKTGINSNEIYNLLFSKSYSKAKLFSKAIYESTIDNGFIFFYLEDSQNYIDDDFDGLAEHLLQIDEASVSLFVRKLDNGKYKANLRSKYDVDVNNIANKFGGGGHKKASGFITEKNIDEILAMIKSML